MDGWVYVHAIIEGDIKAVACCVTAFKSTAAVNKPVLGDKGARLIADKTLTHIPCKELVGYLLLIDREQVFRLGWVLSIAPSCPTVENHWRTVGDDWESVLNDLLPLLLCQCCVGAEPS